MISLATLGPLSFLLVAMTDDLVYRKFHNGLFIALCLLGYGLAMWHAPHQPAAPLIGAGAALAVFLPLSLLGVVGAGDLKFMMCFGLLVSPLAVFAISTYSIIWGGIIGALQALISGRAKLLAMNLLVHRGQVSKSSHNKIPFTVAIALGWLSFINWGTPW